MAKWARRRRRVRIPPSLNQYYAANGNMIGQPTAVEPETIDPYAYYDPDAIRQALCVLDCREVSGDENGDGGTITLHVD